MSTPTPVLTPAPASESLLDADMAEIARKNPGRFWLVLAAVATFVLMALSAWRQGWFTPMTNIYVELPGASGVQIGTPVKLKGFKIGDVDFIDLQPNLSVRARLRIIDARMHLLGQEASARFGRDGPLAGKYIDVLPGSREGARLAADATLPMDVGNELEDVMGTVKVAVEKLALAIGKIEPILDDTKKLTGEAAEIRKDVSKSLTTVLSNMQDMSQQLKSMGQAASGVASRMDKEAAIVMSNVTKITTQAEGASTSAKNALASVEKELPPTLAQVQNLLQTIQQASDEIKAVTQDARAVSQDAKAISKEARQDIPASLRQVRSATQDAAEITEGAKRIWPLSSVISAPAAATATVLPLDGFEGRAR